MRKIRIEFIFGSLIATGTATIDATNPQSFTISFKWEPSVICSNSFSRSETYAAKNQVDTLQGKNKNLLSQKNSNNWEFCSETLVNKTILIISHYSGKKLFFSSRNMSNGAVPFLGGRSPPNVKFFNYSVVP